MSEFEELEKEFSDYTYKNYIINKYLHMIVLDFLIAGFQKIFFDVQMMGNNQCFFYNAFDNL